MRVSTRKRAAQGCVRSGYCVSRVLTFAAIAAVLVILAGAGGTAYALSLEGHDEFCASCHTEPETMYVARARQAAPADLASLHQAKNVRCIDCHGGAPPVERLAGLMQGAQDYARFLSGDYHHPAVTTNPLPDANCVKCHNDLFASRALQNHWHYYLPAWQRDLGPGAARCVDCHNSHTTAQGNIVKFVPDTRINPICQACHSYQGIR